MTRLRNRAEGRIFLCLALCFQAGLDIAARPAPGPAPEVEKTAARLTLERYLRETETRRRNAAVPARFEIDASLPRLKKHGIMRGVRFATDAGRIVFTQLHFVGDDLVRKAVIARFMAAETHEQAGEEFDISERNYRFHYARKSSYNARTVFVFRVDPKRRQLGLFKGELWIDSATAEPLREWGDFIKSPSVLVSRVSVVRDYIWNGDHSRPLRIIVKLRAAFLGPVEVTMWLDERSGNL